MAQTFFGSVSPYSFIFSGIGGCSVLQHLVLHVDHHGGAGVDHDGSRNVRAPLLDTSRGGLLLVSLFGKVLCGIPNKLHRYMALSISHAVYYLF